MKNIQTFKSVTSVDGNEVRKAIKKSGFTKEQVVASVQDLGFRFSLAGLDRIYRGELPIYNAMEILEAIALKCRCQVSDFAEPETKSA